MSIRNHSFQFNRRMTMAIIYLLYYHYLVIRQINIKKKMFSFFLYDLFFLLMTIRNKYLVYNESKFFVLFQCTCSYRIKQEREREKKHVLS